MNADPEHQPENDQAPSGKPPKAPGTRVRFIIYMVISYCSMQMCVYLFDQLFDQNTRVSAEISANLAAWIAIVIVSLMNFFWLMHFVYRTADGHRGRQFWKYLQSIVGFRLWEALVFYVICKLLGGGDPSSLDLLVSSTIMQAQSVLMKYVVYNKLIFRSDHPPSGEELALHDSPPDLSED